MRSISIELKIVLSIILFTIFIVGLERYQLSENIMEQFVESKKSKQTLLKETIAPILALNLSLGLSESNKEYLDQIVKQNSDLESVELIGLGESILYRYAKGSNEKFKKDFNDMNFCSKEILDPISQENMGSIYLRFNDNEYQSVLEKNRETTFEIFGITFILLVLFVFFIKREFVHLKKLSAKVLSYDPNKIDDFVLMHTNRTDEVGVIHNAIISMVEKINFHSKLLDDLNTSLENKVKERTKELENANIKLKELSLTDPLTDLSNRRDFEKNLSETWDIAKRKNTYLSLIMCDIDHFKDVNDTYGHPAGDIVLKNIAKILKDSLNRSTDFVARYGGEEFVIILFDTKADGAHELCLDIQDKLKKMDYIIDEDVTIPSITMSFGISTLIPNTNNSSDNVFRSADIALYEAKGSGRNCIMHNDEGDKSLL